MILRPIRTERQYDKALSRAYKLMQENLRANSPEADELEVLAMLIERYESEIYPHPPETE